MTMAVEAARDCLIGQDRDTVKAVSFASTTLPFLDRLNAGIVAEALSLEPDIAAHGPDGVAARGHLGADRGHADGARRRRPVLVVASEKRRAKAAGPSRCRPAMALPPSWSARAGRWRACWRAPRAPSISSTTIRGEGNEFDYQWEERWIRDEGYIKIVPAGDQGGLPAGGSEAPPTSRISPCRACCRGWRRGIAKAAGMPDKAVRDKLHAVCGDTGAAHPLMLLVDALEKAKAGRQDAGGRLRPGRAMRCCSR